MDWTGGTRRQYAGKVKGNAVVQKQKAHFARARAATVRQVVPDAFAELAAASGSQQPLMGVNPIDLNHARVSKTRESSLSRGTCLKSYERGRYRDADPTARTTARRKHVRRPHSKPQAVVTGEEAVLIANRERLLARNDWLGLAATRPLRIKFPSDRERQRIGTRRKIDKSKARERQAAEIHAISHIPGVWQLPFEPMMSGAIGSDDIQIKVGTDAFLSQTQRSRPSHHSANNSIRPVSTDFGPTSEESMLLKADSDGFEAQEEDCMDLSEDFGPVEQRLRAHSREYFDAQYDVHILPEQDGPPAHSEYSPVYENTQNFYPLGTIDDSVDSMNIGQYSHTEPSHVQDHWATMGQDRSGCGLMYQNAGKAYTKVHTPIISDRRVEAGTTAEILYLEREDTCEPRALVPERMTMESQNPGHFENQSSMYPEASAITSHSGHSAPRDSAWPKFEQVTEMPFSEDMNEDDEQIWKRFMQVKQDVSSRASVAALRSSSQHLTPSTTSAWPKAAAEAEHDDGMLDNQEHLDDLYLEAGQRKDSRSEVVSKEVSLPSLSHRQNQLPVKQTPLTEIIAEDDEQGELWRQFVVGSQSSQISSSSSGGGRLQQTKSSDELLQAQLSSVMSTAGQLRSDRMTTGGSHAFATTDSQDDDSSQSRMNTSLIGHATTINLKRDDVEEHDSELRIERRGTNIHADPMLDTRPKRHYQSRRRTKYAPVPRVLTKASTLAKPKCVYDMLMDSEF